MPSVCFYFEVHQPFRLRRYSVFEAMSAHGRSPQYFDDRTNREVAAKVAAKCYLPANRLILDLVRRHAGRFRVSYAVTGTAMDQFALYAPEVLDSFAALAGTGCVEFLAETYHHSLASVAGPAEFAAQVELHRRRLADAFGVTPRVFRNTELIYDNTLARRVAEMGFVGVLAEGVDRVLGWRSPNFVYRPPASRGPSILLKNYGLSDDIAFRFSDRNWAGWPLTPRKFAASLAGQPGPLTNLFMDYETLGEHQWADTGIFDFLAALPEVLPAEAGADFVTVSEAVERFPPVGELDVSRATSWADSERDLSAWLGNPMQNNALMALYELEKPVKDTGDLALIEDWRRLTTSDHLYYMSTKGLSDGEVHAYFSPYDNPYDAYINFMNVLDNLRRRIKRA